MFVVNHLNHIKTTAIPCGGFNPIEKYSCQIGPGSFPQVRVNQNEPATYLEDHPTW